MRRLLAYVFLLSLITTTILSVNALGEEKYTHWAIFFEEPFEKGKNVFVCLTSYDKYLYVSANIKDIGPVIIKVDAKTGEFLWIKSLECILKNKSLGKVLINTMTFTPDGYLYFAGTFRGDVIVIKFDPKEDKVVSSIIFGGDKADVPCSVVFSNGYVYVIGDTESYTGGIGDKKQIFVAKINIDKRRIEKFISFGNTFRPDTAKKGLIGFDGNIYVAGTTFTSEGFEDILAVKLNSTDLGIIWSKCIKRGGAQFVEDAIITHDGKLCVLAGSTSEKKRWSSIIAQFDPNTGDVVLFKAFGEPKFPGTLWFLCMIEAPDGSLYLGGSKYRFRIIGKVDPSYTKLSVWGVCGEVEKMIIGPGEHLYVIGTYERSTMFGKEYYDFLMLFSPSIGYLDWVKAPSWRKEGFKISFGKDWAELYDIKPAYPRQIEWAFDHGYVNPKDIKVTGEVKVEAKSLDVKVKVVKAVDTNKPISITETPTPSPTTTPTTPSVTTTPVTSITSPTTSLTTTTPVPTRTLPILKTIPELNVRVEVLKNVTTIPRTDQATHDNMVVKFKAVTTIRKVNVYVDNVKKPGYWVSHEVKILKSNATGVHFKIIMNISKKVAPSVDYLIMPARAEVIKREPVIALDIGEPTEGKEASLDVIVLTNVTETEFLKGIEIKHILVPVGAAGIPVTSIVIIVAVIVIAGVIGFRLFKKKPIK